MTREAKSPRLSLRQFYHMHIIGELAIYTHNEGKESMTDTKFDCVVLGSGPGGYVAAIRAAQLGMRTACVEKESPGGVCLNWGCIPTKALLKSAEVYQHLLHAQDFGLRAEKVSFDFPEVIDRSRQVVERMTKGVSFLLKKNKVEFIKGTGTFSSKKSLTVKDDNNSERELFFDAAVIATGARARSMASLPVDGNRVLNYRHALALKNHPKKILVVGAGAIGAEFAYFYHSFGSDVTLVEVLENILPVEDDDISKAVQRSFHKKGIRVLTSTVVDSLKSNGNCVSALLRTGEKCEQWDGDYCLVAVGMQGNYENIGLERLGIVPERSFIRVNQTYQTSVSHIYAIGDIIGPPLLAHVASHEGIIAVEHLAGIHPHLLDYSSIPACTYCKPQVASIGLTEKAALGKGHSIAIGKFPFTASGRAVASNETDGFVKVVIAKETEEILGIHIVHDEASELIGETSIIKSHEAVASSVLNSIHAHPTLTEAIMEAMGDALGRAVHI